MPQCGTRNVQCGIEHKTMTHRCRECPRKPMSTIRTGSVMQSSKLSYRVWAIAIYPVSTGLNGVSSMKLHRDVGITQKSAWHLAHRIRRGFEADHGPFEGPVEIDETYVGGKEKNKHWDKKGHVGGGSKGKTSVVGIKDHDTNQVATKSMASVTKKKLEKMISGTVAPDAEKHTDESALYNGMPNHKSVNHAKGIYVTPEGVTTNGLESHWSRFKRGFIGTYHKMSPKQLQRYADEFAGRHNIREQDTIDQLASLAKGMNGKRLTYKQLIADNGMPSGARAA